MCHPKARTDVEIILRRAGASYCDQARGRLRHMMACFMAVISFPSLPAIYSMYFFLLSLGHSISKVYCHCSLAYPLFGPLSDDGCLI